VGKNPGQDASESAVSEPLDDADAAALEQGVIDLDDARTAALEPGGGGPPGLDSERPVVLEDRRDDRDDDTPDVEEPLDPRDA
jgi:hypothetical protein